MNAKEWQAVSEGRPKFECAGVDGAYHMKAKVDDAGTLSLSLVGRVHLIPPPQWRKFARWLLEVYPESQP